MRYHRFFQSILSLLFVVALLSPTAQVNAQDKIHWIDWDQVQVLMKKQKRKVLVDIYSDWCGWCKRMDATTFQDPRIIQYLNRHYYTVKFNAEFKDDIQFKTRVYKYMENGRRGIHQLAIEITNGQLSYPTFVFMDEEFNTIQPLPGYQDADTFEIITNFFGGNHYKTTPYKSFMENFRSAPNKKP